MDKLRGGALFIVRMKLHIFFFFDAILVGTFLVQLELELLWYVL